MTLAGLVRPSTTALLRNDDGVTGMWFAVLLVVFLGMLALSMDGGLLFVRFRAIRNANDAAALAAAQSCAKGDGQAAANAQANSYAANNSSGAVSFGAGNVYAPACDPSGGQVTVHYQGEQDLYVAPMIGVDSPKTIQAQATALWGGAGGASNIAPLMISSNISSCPIPDVALGQHCFLWWDDDELGSAEWGLMNLNKWDVSSSDGCTGSAGQSQIKSWIEVGYPTPLMLHQPPPTYVCTVNGFRGNSLNNVLAPVDGQAGRKLIFPINDPSQETPNKYAIVGFSVMEVVTVWKGQQAKNHCPGHADAKNGSIRCLEAIWRGPLPGGIVPCIGCENFGLFSVQLSE